MGASELTTRLLIYFSKIGGRLFRNTTGMGWTSNIKFKMPDGSLILKNPRPLRAGLVTGGSDTIGWTPILITPEMVGKTIPVFTAVEVKAGKDRASREQVNFIAEVNTANGIAFILRDETKPEEELNKWKQKNGCS